MHTRTNMHKGAAEITCGEKCMTVVFVLLALQSLCEQLHQILLDLRAQDESYVSKCVTICGVFVCKCERVRACVFVCMHV